MKKILRMVLMIFLILGVLMGLAFWILTTEAGTRFFLRSIFFFSPWPIQVQQIEGKILEEIHLEGLQIRGPNLTLQARAMKMKWRGRRLLERKIDIHEIILREVRIHDTRIGFFSPSDFQWPSIPFWLSRFEGRLGSFKIEGLNYQRMNEAPTTVQSISLSLEFRDGRLILPFITMRADWGMAQARGDATLDRPSIRFHLDAQASKGVFAFEGLSLHLDLLPDPHRDETTGTLRVRSFQPSMDLFHFEADLRIGRKVLQIQSFRLWEAQRKGILRGDGELRWATRPPLRLQLNFSGFDLEPEVGISTNLSGTLKVSGSPEKYRGELHLANPAEGWPGFRLATLLQGNLGGCEFPNLNLSWLKGSAKGRLRLSWVGGLLVEGQIQGRGLNPSLVDKNWEGTINGNLEGELRFISQRPPQGFLTVELLESQIARFSLKGEVRLLLEDGRLHFSPLILRSQGFDLRAEGILQERVKVLFSSKDPDPIVPGLSGIFRADGWVRLRDGRLSGSLLALGRDGSYGPIQTRSLEATIDLKEFPLQASPLLSLKAQLKDLSAGPFIADEVSLNLNGSPESHRVFFSIHHRQGKIKGSLAGGLHQGRWKASVETLEGQTPIGLWTLREPISLLVSPQEFQISPLRIESQKGERADFSAHFFFRPFRGKVSGKWQKVNLSHLNPWLREGTVSGQSNGKFSVELTNGGSYFTGSMDLHGTFRRPPYHLSISSGTLQGRWGPQGFQASAMMYLNGGGRFQGHIFSPQTPQWKLPERIGLEAQWKDLDMNLFQPWLPPDWRIGGRLGGSLKGGISPGWNIEMKGDASISQGNFVWESRQIQIPLKEGQIQWSWKERALKGNISWSSNSMGRFSGSFDLPVIASIPPRVDQFGPLRISLWSDTDSHRLLFQQLHPLLDESQALLGLSLQVEGTLTQPKIKGSCKIEDFILPLRSKGDVPKDGRVFPKLTIPSGKLEFQWDKGGLRAASFLKLERDGLIRGNLFSPQTPQLGLPDRGEFEIKWESLDLSLLRPLLPDRILLNGQCTGEIKGFFSPGYRLDLTAENRLSRGTLQLKSEGGQIGADLERASIGITWREETLAGRFSLGFSRRGWVEGKFELPIPARIPWVVQPSGPLRISLEGRAEESGILSSFFPGLLEDSRGQVEMNLQADGTWGKPRWKGFLQIAQGRVKVPQLGIQMQAIQARFNLQNDRIQIESFRAQSGPGWIGVEGSIRLEDGKPSRYEGHLRGERFQAIYLPEMRLQGNPDLKIEGDGKKMKVRGEIKIPECQIYGDPPGPPVRSSPDVQIIDERANRRQFPLQLDLEVRLVLGDRVIVSTHGLDARLAGSLNLSGTGIEKTRARGEIYVVEGHYSSWGIKLKILHGRFSFTGGPIDRPEVDLLAMKQVKDVEVGVKVSGALQNPIVKLYSKPSMSDTDILSYIALGRPFSLSTSAKEADLLLAAAGALLSQAESISLRDRIRGYLWLDTVDIQAGRGDLSRSMVTIGKFLTPDLYLSLGYSIFENSQIITLRYRVSPRWEVESRWGTPSGIDLFYRIEFF